MEIAGGAIGFLLARLDTLVATEWGLREKIQDEVKGLKLELETIRAFLTEAEGKEKTEQVKVWIKQVQEQAHEIEDTLDEVEYHMAAQSTHHWTITKSKQRHALRKRISKINGDLEKIKKMKDRYNDISSVASTSTADTSLHVTLDPLYVVEANIVGIEKPMEDLICWVKKDKASREVLFLVGMGGQGKTTLVKNVYNSVKTHFDLHACINISRDKNQVLKELCTAMDVTLQQPGLDAVNLIKLVWNALENKKYMVVLDNLLDKDVWDIIQHALPISKHSRIIITTRRGDIARSFRDPHVLTYDLTPLSAENAQKLFYQTIFQSPNPQDKLRIWGERILKKCEGLPLGILSIGKILANKDSSPEEWKKLNDSIGSELGNEGCLSSITEILAQSYQDLPSRLKYCFVYLSMFPEDHNIRSRKLIRLWIAENFVKEKNGKTVEEVGEEYLRELIDRSLILVSESDFDGKPKTCRLHNLMHKIMVSVSEEEKISFAFTHQRSFDEKARRMTIIFERDCDNPNSMPTHVRQLHGVSNKKLKCARSFFMFGMEPSFAPVILPSFKLLKVLDLEDAPLDDFPDEISSLFLLKYLSLRNTNISSLPHSIADLKNLETLDLKQTQVTGLPMQMRQLQRLRHLLIYRYDMQGHQMSVTGFWAIKIIGGLTSLEKLAFLDASKHPEMIRELGNLTKLRRLGMTKIKENDGKELCHSIAQMEHLRSLNLTSIDITQFLNLQSLTSPPIYLKRVYLKGPLPEFPNWICKLDDLVRIRLKWSRLRTNPIPSLENLPNLLELQLFDAYTGSYLHFDAHKFAKLKILELESLDNLEMVIIGEGALPCLTKFIVRRCHKLAIPWDMNHLTRLEEFSVCQMQQKFVAEASPIPQFRRYTS